MSVASKASEALRWKKVQVAKMDNSPVKGWFMLLQWLLAEYMDCHPLKKKPMVNYYPHSLRKAFLCIVSYWKASRLRRKKVWGFPFQDPYPRRI